MIVEVVQLRKCGQKIPRELLSGAVRGRLEIRTNRSSYGMVVPQPPCVIAALRHEHQDPFPGWSHFSELRGAVVTSLDSRGFVIVGQETVYEPGRGQPTYWQAWACRPV